MVQVGNSLDQRKAETSAFRTASRVEAPEPPPRLQVQLRIDPRTTVGNADVMAGRVLPSNPKKPPTIRLDAPAPPTRMVSSSRLKRRDNIAFIFIMYGLVYAFRKLAIMVLPSGVSTDSG